MINDTITKLIQYIHYIIASFQCIAINISIVLTLAYQLPWHTSYLDIPVILAYQLPWHTSYLDIPVTLTYQLPWHTSYLDIPVILTYQLSWYTSYFDIPVTLTYQWSWHTSYLDIPHTYRHILETYTKRFGIAYPSSINFSPIFSIFINVEITGMSMLMYLMCRRQYTNENWLFFLIYLQCCSWWLSFSNTLGFWACCAGKYTKKRVNGIQKKREWRSSWWTNFVM